MKRPDHDFDETLISGYVDGELTQQQAQLVRVHLEDCSSCRATTNELERLREATMDSRFQMPPDMQWSEAPRSGTSHLLRSAGIVIGLAWLIGVIAWLVIELAGSEDILGILLVGGFVLSAGLIIGSALLDRRAAAKTDPYRRVKK